MRPAPLITISSTVKRAVGSTVRWSGWTWKAAGPKTWSNMSFSVRYARRKRKKMAWKLNFSSAKKEDNLKRRHFRDSLPWRYIKVPLMKLCFLDHFVVSRTLLRMCYMQVLSKQRPSWQRPHLQLPATKCAKREKNSRSTCVLSPVGSWNFVDRCFQLQVFTLACRGVKRSNSIAHLSHCGT